MTDSGIRIDPIACIGPERKDARRLLVVWFVNKSFWWMFFALGLAYPLARAHDAALEPRAGWNRHWGTFSDRYKVAKAYRLLRWTHHVRQVALDRVAPGPSWWRRIDPILDVVNIVAVIAFLLVTVVIAAIQVG